MGFNLAFQRLKPVSKIS